MKLLQLDFPAPQGHEMTRTCSGQAQDLALAPGLIWKIWTENAATNEAGGIYLFGDEPSLDAYLAAQTERLRSFGVDHIRARKLDVNGPLTQIAYSRTEH
jgi:Putative mono-oxygenase ydhR